MDGQADRWTDQQTDRQVNRQMGRQAGRQVNKQADRGRSSEAHLGRGWSVAEPCWAGALFLQSCQGFLLYFSSKPSSAATLLPAGKSLASADLRLQL